MDKVRELKNAYDTRAKYAQVKRDGYRLRITRNPQGVVKVWTRRPKDWTAMVRNLPTAQTLWTRLNEPCILHAEVWREDTDATSVITHVKSACPQVKLSVFGVERALPPEATLTEVAMWCVKHGLDFIPYFIRGTRDAGCLGTFTSLADLPRPYGDVEGYVFKDYNGSEFGPQWQKWTIVKKITLRVSGLEPGKTGKNIGRVGSLICEDVSGVEVCAASGFSEAIRKRLTNADVGRAIEVAFKGVGSNGRLRMPRFLRFRDDIDPSNVDSIKDLIGHGN